MSDRSAPRLLALAVLLAVVTGGASAGHQVVLRATANTFSLGAFRVVSVVGTTARDVSAEGLRIGLAGGEERFAFVRPVFAGDPRPLSAYRVTSAVIEDNPTSAALSVPTTMWDAGTPPELLVTIRRSLSRPATGEDLAGLFQGLVDRGNDPGRGPGLILTSTEDFRNRPVRELTFAVSLEVADFVRIHFFAPLAPVPPLDPLQPQVRPNFLLSWTPSRTGLADLTVNTTRILSRGRVQGLRVIPTIVFSPFIVTGNNTISIQLFPEDAPSGATPVTTTVVFVVPQVIR